MYCVTETLERQGTVVTAVPDIWIKNENTLLWPSNINNNKLRKMREKRVHPDDNWISIPINRILFKNIRKFLQSTYRIIKLNIQN